MSVLGTTVFCCYNIVVGEQYSRERHEEVETSDSKVTVQTDRNV